MLVTMSRQSFESVDITELGWACLAPIMEPLRGKDPIRKSQVYSSLSPSQQALFMFYAYYNHAKHSLHEYYWWTAYYFAQPKIWTEIKRKLRDFRDHDMVELLEQAEQTLQKWDHPRRMEAVEISLNDLEHDSALGESISVLFNRFHDITLCTRTLIGEFIRKNPEEFVQILAE